MYMDKSVAVSVDSADRVGEWSKILGADTYVIAGMPVISWLRKLEGAYDIGG